MSSTFTPPAPPRAVGDTFDEGRVNWVMTLEDVERLKAAIQTSIEVVYDLETTGLDEHATNGGRSNGGVAARIVIASFTLPQTDDGQDDPYTWLVPLSHPDSPLLGCWRKVVKELTEVLWEGRKALVGHNVKFDCRWLYAFSNYDLSEFIEWDTQISSHLLDENSSTKLKVVAPDTFQIDRWDDFDLTTPGAAEQVPLFALGEYAARDTYWTWRLAQKHRQDMFLGDAAEWEPEDEDEVELYRLGRLATWAAMPATRSLTRIEQNGFKVDVEWMEDMLVQCTESAAKYWDELVNLYPEEADPSKANFQPTATWFAEWTSAAVAHGDLKVASLTKGGRPQWSKAVLMRQARNGSDVALKLLALRQAMKRMEYLNSWLDKVTSDGYIYTTYNAGSVVTGRLSSSGPNMQQVSKALRPGFIASPGCVLIDLDYSQIELRVAAFISRCQPMINAFLADEDLHTLLAQQIIRLRRLKDMIKDDPQYEGMDLQEVSDLLGGAFSIRSEEVTPDDRQAGKSANFGLLYLMGAAGFREYAETVYGVMFTQEEAAMVHATFFSTWDGMQQWHERVQRRVMSTGQIVSPIGRVRRVPGVWSQNDQTATSAIRQAVNSPVQGFASDLMQMACASIQGLLPGTTAVDGVRVVATVHDSIVVEVPADNWEEIGKTCQQRMVEVVKWLPKMGTEMDVPLKADGKAGTRWSLSDVGELD